MVDDIKVRIKILTPVEDWKTRIVLLMATPVSKKAFKTSTGQCEGEGQGRVKGIKINFV